MRHTIFCTFLCRCFARLQRESSRNFLHGHTFYGENVVHVIFHFFFHCRLFFPWSPLAFLIFSPPLQIHVVQSNKKWLPISRSSCLSLNFRFPFSSLLTLQLSLLHKTRFPAKWPRVAFGLPYLLIQLFCIGMSMVRTGGRADGRTVTWLPKFLGLPHFLRYGVTLASS